MEMDNVCVCVECHGSINNRQASSKNFMLFELDANGGEDIVIWVFGVPSKVHAKK